ncbi:MAG: hypothetical protein QG570_337 [Patescibacteria group bacterium]|nr:hypothetical protein [Patescibacteria group bacterium]
MRHTKLLTIILLLSFVIGLGNVGINSVSAAVPAIPVPISPQGDISLCDSLLRNGSFKWTSVPGATGYTMQIASVSDFSSLLVNYSSSSNQIFLGGINLAVGTYYWRVQAYNSDGSSAWSLPISFHVIPSAPVLVSPTANGFVLPNPLFKWTTCHPFDTQMQISNRPDFSLIILDVNFNANTFTHLSPYVYEYKFSYPFSCGMYWWRVRTKLGAEASSWVSQMFIVTVPPAVSPDILYPTQSIIADTSINLKWSYVSSADRYQIQICRGSNYLLDTIITGTSYTFKGQDDTTYCFRVRAGNHVGWGPWSEWRQFKILLPPATPILNSVPSSFVNTNKIIVSWSQAGVVDYWFLEIWDLTNQVKSEEQLTNNVFTFTGQYSHSYQVRVRAINQSGSSSWSAWLGPIEFKENIPPVLVLNDYPTLTNQTVITISGKASDEGSGLSKLYCNGQLIPVNNDGTFQITLTLQEGTNSFTFLAVDFVANKTQQSIEIQKDTIPPEIIITFPSFWSADTVATVISDIALKGQIKDSHPVTLLINNQTVALENCYFSFNTALNYGPNKIYLKAIDAAGNVTERIITLAKILATRKVELQVNNPCMKIYQINEAGQIITISREIDPGRGTVPVIVNNRTFIPIRALIETIGGSVKWNDQLRQVTIELPYRNTVIDLWIDKNWARITDSYGNVSWQQIDQGNSKIAPFIKNDRTYLPLRFIVETLGFKVNWDAILEIITVEFPLTPS